MLVEVWFLVLLAAVLLMAELVRIARHNLQASGAPRRHKHSAGQIRTHRVAHSRETNY